MLNLVIFWVNSIRFHNQRSYSLTYGECYPLTPRQVHSALFMPHMSPHRGEFFIVTTSPLL